MRVLYTFLKISQKVVRAELTKILNGGNVKMDLKSPFGDKTFFREVFVK